MNTTRTTAITHFNFEADFVEENVRCIPMIVRFKLDACGIKLKLSEWSSMTVEEREMLATQPCETVHEVDAYENYLRGIIKKRTGNEATRLVIDTIPAWSIKSVIPTVLQQRLTHLSIKLSVHQWENLYDLQRFALIKLSSAGHEQKNLPKALREFGLML